MVVTDAVEAGDDLERQLAAQEGARFRRWDGSSDLGEMLAGSDVVFTNFAPLDRTALARLATGAVVIRYGVGVDNVDLAAAADHGVRVCNVPDYGTDVVADHAAMLALLLVRRVRQFDAAMQQGQHPVAATFGPIPSLGSLTVGLVGAGRIAQLTARRLRAFGCRTIAQDPYADPARLSAEHLGLVGWDELLSTSDVVSLHAPLTAQTHHLFDDTAFAALRPGAFLVNTARGGLVDTQALTRALSGGRLAGAALDVTEPEPLPAQHPLRSLPEVILTPHVAFYSAQSVARLQALAVEEGRRALRGEQLRCPVPLPATGSPEHAARAEQDGPAPDNPV